MSQTLSWKRTIRFANGHVKKDVNQTMVERETGLEPATFCLGSRHSTTELLPLDDVPKFYDTQDGKASICKGPVHIGLLRVSDEIIHIVAQRGRFSNRPVRLFSVIPD